MSETHKPIAVCATWRTFPDDEQGACTKCRVALFYRPHTGRLGFPLYCFPCFTTMARPGDLIGFTRETVDEITLLDAQTKGKPS